MNTSPLPSASQTASDSASDHAAAPAARNEATQYSRIQTSALIIIAFAVVLFLLVQAQFLLVSLATAIVLFSLTSDAINFIARIKVGPFRIPNWLASIAALLLISAVLLTLTSIILSQINTVLSTALAYTERAPFAIAALFSWLGEDIEASILNTVRTADISGYLRQLAAQAGNLLQATVLVILFVGFLFAERIWFNTKMTNFFRDEAQAKHVSRIIGSIIHRVNYYLLVKTAVSIVTGLMVFSVCKLFSLDLAVAMGILTFVLNYIPNIGSIVATDRGGADRLRAARGPVADACDLPDRHIHPVPERQCHRPDADGPRAAAVVLRDHHQPRLLGGGLGHSGDVPVGADHGGADDHLQPYPRIARPGRAAVARGPAGHRARSAKAHPQPWGRACEDGQNVTCQPRHSAGRISRGLTPRRLACVISPQARG